MKIIVCVKLVPDTESRIKISADKKSIETSDITWILNPYDEFAVEEAVQLKEKNGDTTITAMTVGNEEALTALRGAVAMGADESVLLKTDAVSDSLAIAEALSNVIKEMDYDLILFGKKAIDDENMQVGTLVAEMLDLPCVTAVAELEFEDKKVIAKREIESGTEVVETNLPAVMTTEKGLNEPRYPSLRGIMMAKRKPVDEKDVEINPSKTEIDNFQYPPTRQAGKVVGEGSSAVPELVRLLKEEAKVI